MNRNLPLATATALALLAPMATASAASAATITLSGSTSVAPLATKLAKAFVQQPKYQGKVKFVILQGGSDIGITDVSRGRVTLGMSSRDPKPADPGGIVFNKIARDAVCVVTNRSNPIPSLSQQQIQDVFSGRIRSWSQVTGSRASGPIDLVVRTAASGTQDAFQNIFMGQTLRVAGSATTKSSNGLQAQTIKSDPNAIGYASFHFTAGLFAVPYLGVPCTLRNAKSGQYGGVRNFYLVSRGRAAGVAKAFIGFARSSSTAKRIVASNWVPLR
ncbi:MAG TPA: phosphate ABC transporter substrate-binding protein [Solirubrobacterales bacterium]